jgi:hypothetical protein
MQAKYGFAAAIDSHEVPCTSVSPFVPGRRVRYGSHLDAKEVAKSSTAVSFLVSTFMALSRSLTTSTLTLWILRSLRAVDGVA